MAARINKFHDAKTREKIRTSQLLNRLQAHVFNELDGKTKKPVEMKSTQIKAAEILLRKVMPDLQSVEGSMNVTVRQEDALRALDDD